MPPKSHAILSASSSHRWLNCNPSARLEQEFEDQETEAAAEGTAAHALCEHKLRKALKLRSKKPVSQYDCDEMDDYTDGYVQFVLEQLAQAKLTCPDPQVLIEQRLDFSCYVPDGFGTGDCLIIASPRLHVIDFKYGLGVLVDAYQNPQMMLYLPTVTTMLSAVAVPVLLTEATIIFAEDVRKRVAIQTCPKLKTLFCQARNKNKNVSHCLMRKAPNSC